MQERFIMYMYYLKVQRLKIGKVRVTNDQPKNGRGTIYTLNWISDLNNAMIIIYVIMQFLVESRVYYVKGLHFKIKYKAKF